MRDVREEYSGERLTPANLADEPLSQLQRWMDEVLARNDVALANAMTLATATAEGRPSCRTVLLKGIEAGGLTFFTHYDSRKGQQIAANPWVAATLFWSPLSRQVTVEGRARALDDAEAEAYFSRRPRGSQISALASPQSEVVEEDWLEAEFARLERLYADVEVPKPERWGGYRIEPEEVQFWQGHEHRLHDRFRYRRGTAGEWRVERLAP